MPLMQLKRVVLPAPLGPISPQICRSPTPKETPATAVTPPNRTTMSRTSRRATRAAARYRVPRRGAAPRGGGGGGGAPGGGALGSPPPAAPPPPAGPARGG